MMPEFSDSGVSDEAGKLLGSYFADASKRLAAIVRKPPGGTAAGREFRQARAAGQIAQVDSILVGLKRQASGWVGKNLSSSYRDGRARGAKQAEEAGVRVARSGLAGDFGVIDQRALVVLARDTAGDLNKAADSIGSAAKTVLRHTAQEAIPESKINQILAGGIIEGKPRDTIRLLKEELEAVVGGTVTIQGKNGPIEFDVGYYAEMVVRTKTREAVETARHNRLAELGIDLVVVTGKVSNSFCTAYLGKIFSLSGKHPKYPALASLPSGGPPFHPNCSKSTRPFVEELARDDQINDGAPGGDVAKLVGVDAATAQKRFKDLQIRQQVEDRFKRSTRRPAAAGA